MAESQGGVTNGNTGKFFSELCRLAEVAEGASQLSENHYRVAGLALTLRFHGDALIPTIAPAIEHNRIDKKPTSPDLVIDCWECESLGLPYPDAPIDKSAFRPRGEVVGMNDDRFHTSYDSGGKLLSMMDKLAGRALYCVGSASRIPRFDAAEPIRSLMSWFMRAHGRQLIHAAAVGHEDGGVLLIGRSGRGKSNTSLTCLYDGLGFASDDFCAVSAGPGPMAYSLYCTAKTRAQDVDRSPFLTQLAPSVDPTGLDKTIYYINDALPERIVRQFPLQALLLLERDEGECYFEPVSAGSVLADSAPDTARLLPDAGPEVLRIMGQLVRRLPCYRLHLGSDSSKIAPAIERLLKAGGDAG